MKSTRLYGALEETMNRLSVILLVAALLAACKPASNETVLADYAKTNEQRAAALKHELGECRAQLARQGSTQGEEASVAVSSSKITVDCFASPYIPNGWEIRPEDQIKSAVRGQLEFDPAKVKLYLAEAQKTGRIVGTELVKQLEGQPVLPANVLDALLANTGRIPESWKQDEAGNTRYIYFWGTIYNHDGSLYVRGLYWYDGRWRWSFRYLAFEFDAEDPAVLLAS